MSDPITQPQERWLGPGVAGVIEVNPDHDPRGELARLVDGLVAALARQRPARSELRTIRS